MERAQLDVTAYHEAGHAIMAWCCGINVNRVSIQATDDMLGHTLFDFSLAQGLALQNDDPDFLRRLALVNMSGMAADFTHWKTTAHEASEDEIKGHCSDQSKAENYLMRAGQVGKAYLDGYLGAALMHLQLPENWQIICDLANRLLAGKVLYAYQIDDLRARVTPVNAGTWQFVEAVRDTTLSSSE